MYGDEGAADVTSESVAVEVLDVEDHAHVEQLYIKKEIKYLDEIKIF